MTYVASLKIGSMTDRQTCVDFPYLGDVTGSTGRPVACSISQPTGPVLPREEKNTVPGSAQVGVPLLPGQGREGLPGVDVDEAVLLHLVRVRGPGEFAGSR